ncbi:GNAT family N-acetyltransferase [Paenibacillus sp. 481]|uniref:GNAT family N-acetyltransferase n=1 Tax=Paenibacillus sp. 481 TaxID=2835869 RepID=UPI001E3E2D21|nr:GNAT family N-acetyltransferase [Paenibacillus sp. 481]
MTTQSLLMMNISEQFETARMYIRKPLLGDGVEVNAAIMESWADLHKWMVWAQEKPTVEETEENIRQAHIHFLERKQFRLQGYHKETGELVFCGGLHLPDWKVRKFEIGYWVRNKYAGKGLVTEAVQKIEQFAIEELRANRLVIQCDAENEQSANVARRCGFTLEGIMRNECYDATGTNLRHTMLFSKVRGIEFN